MIFPREDVPSRRLELLAPTIGQRLIRLVRYSRLPLDEALSEYGVPQAQLFGLTAGPLALELESGCILGAGSQPSLNSVTLWLERDDRGQMPSDPMSKDETLTPIPAQDPRYADARWNAIPGQRVTSISILRRSGQSVLHDDLPSEVAVQLELESGDSIFLAHGLHDDSDDFSVLHREEILPEIAANLRVIEKLGP
jgi:hypothetical protein